MSENTVDYVIVNSQGFNFLIPVPCVYKIISLADVQFHMKNELLHIVSDQNMIPVLSLGTLTNVRRNQEAFGCILIIQNDMMALTVENIQDIISICDPIRPLPQWVRSYSNRFLTGCHVVDEHTIAYIIDCHQILELLRKE